MARTDAQKDRERYVRSRIIYLNEIIAQIDSELRERGNSEKKVKRLRDRKKSVQENLNKLKSESSLLETNMSKLQAIAKASQKRLEETKPKFARHRKLSVLGSADDNDKIIKELGLDDDLKSELSDMSGGTDEGLNNILRTFRKIKNSLPKDSGMSNDDIFGDIDYLHSGVGVDWGGDWDSVDSKSDKYITNTMDLTPAKETKPAPAKTPKTAPAKETKTAPAKTPKPDNLGTIKFNGDDRSELTSQFLSDMKKTFSGDQKAFDRLRSNGVNPIELSGALMNGVSLNDMAESIAKKSKVNSYETSGAFGPNDRAKWNFEDFERITKSLPDKATKLLKSSGVSKPITNTAKPKEDGINIPDYLLYAADNSRVGNFKSIHHGFSFGDFKANRDLVDSLLEIQHYQSRNPDSPSAKRKLDRLLKNLSTDESLSGSLDLTKILPDSQLKEAYKQYPSLKNKPTPRKTSNSTKVQTLDNLLDEVSENQQSAAKAKKVAKDTQKKVDSDIAKRSADKAAPAKAPAKTASKKDPAKSKEMNELLSKRESLRGAMKAHQAKGDDVKAAAVKRKIAAINTELKNFKGVDPNVKPTKDKPVPKTTVTPRKKDPAKSKAMNELLSKRESLRGAMKAHKAKGDEAKAESVRKRILKINKDLKDNYADVDPNAHKMNTKPDPTKDANGKRYTKRGVTQMIKELKEKNERGRKGSAAQKQREADIKRLTKILQGLGKKTGLAAVQESAAIRQIATAHLLN